MRSRIINILLVLAMLAGVGVLAYPFVSNVLHDRKQDEVITEYDESVEALSEAGREEMLAAARAYNEDLTGDVVLTDPFDPAAVSKIREGYEELLNVDGDGIMGYVEIPRIGVYEAVYHGTSDEVLSKGIGHLANTSLPVGGKGTHAVLSGHTGLPEAELFTNLTEIEEGDVFYIHVLGETLAYETDRIEVVEPSDTESLQIDVNEDYVTLVTCTPYGINSHRLLVRGTRVPYTESVKAAGDAQAAEGMDAENWKTVYGRALLTGAVLAAALLFGIWFIARLRRNRREKSRRKAEKHRRRR